MRTRFREVIETALPRIRQGITELLHKPRLIFLFACIIMIAITVGTYRRSLPITYSDLCPFPSNQFGLMSKEDGLRWMEEKYHPPFPPLQPQVNDGVVSYGWMKEPTRALYISFRDDTLYSYYAENIQDGPTLGQVVAGLGTPDSVFGKEMLWADATSYWLVLLYPKAGISVSVSKFNRALSFDALINQEWKNGAVYLSEELRVSNIDCYPASSSLQEMVTNTAGYKPWPGFGTWLPLTKP